MLQVAPGQIAYMTRYDNNLRTGYKFSLESFKDKQLVSRLTSQSIKWDTLYNWTVRDYMIRDFADGREIITTGTSLDTIIKFEPRDFLISENDHETLTSPQLNAYIQRQKERGVSNIKSFEIEHHRRYAMTAAAFILTVIGMSLSSKKVRGGMGLNIGIGLALSFSYILFMTVTSTFAVSGLTSPMVAMWIPNIIYTIVRHRSLPQGIGRTININPNEKTTLSPYSAALSDICDGTGYTTRQCADRRHTLLAGHRTG